MRKEAGKKKEIKNQLRFMGLVKPLGSNVKKLRAGLIENK